MKLKNLLTTTCIAVTILLAACSKNNDAAVNTTDLTSYYIAGEYNNDLSATGMKVPIPYAIVLKANSACTFVDAVLGVVKGTYTYKNGHLVTTFNGNLNADFDFTVADNTITQASPDGLALLSYNLQKTPPANAFTNIEYTGTLNNSNNGATFTYLACSGSQFSLSYTGYITPDVTYTLQNNAVAFIETDSGSCVLVFDNGTVEAMDYILPAQVNGNPAYLYGTFTKP